VQVLVPERALVLVPQPPVLLRALLLLAPLRRHRWGGSLPHRSRCER